MLWDVVVVGAGPAGTAAALGVLSSRPRSKVLLLDRAEFPRDKACGDGIAPHVLDVLADVGLIGVLDDWQPLRTLALRHGPNSVVRQMPRPAWVVPRTVFDNRLYEAAVQAGAEVRHHRVRSIELGDDEIVVDGQFRTSVLIGADGANSYVRKAIGLSHVRRTALAIRGYTPTHPAWEGRQEIVFGVTRQPSYAWAFDRGDGLSNVGYGEVMSAGTKGLTRKAMLHELEALLPGSTEKGNGWLAHHLPLSSWTWRHPTGRVLLVGDAAGLVNPMTGEGIYYAVATGVLAGRAVVSATGGDSSASAAALYRTGVKDLLGRHLKHSAVAGFMYARPRMLNAGIAAASNNQQVFEDLVEIGLGRGKISRPLFTSLVGAAWRVPRPRGQKS